MSDIKMSERFGRVPDFDIKEFFEDTQHFAIPNVHLCYQDINKAVNNYDHLVEENAKLKANQKRLQTDLGEQDFKIASLKADKAELLECLIKSTSDDCQIWLKGKMPHEIIKKHKGESNG